MKFEGVHCWGRRGSKPWIKAAPHGRTLVSLSPFLTLDPTPSSDPCVKQVFHEVTKRHFHPTALMVKLKLQKQTLFKIFCPFFKFALMCLRNGETVEQRSRTKSTLQKDTLQKGTFIFLGSLMKLCRFLPIFPPTCGLYSGTPRNFRFCSSSRNTFRFHSKQKGIHSSV